MSRTTRSTSALAALLGATFAVVAAAAPVGAHTGHPTEGLADGLVHPVFGPDHLLAMLAVGVVAALVRDRRAAWLTPAGFVAGMLLGGGLGIAGLEVPGLELLVAASVLVLGVLVLRGVAAAVWLPALAATFGVAHGLAHGGEVPAGASAAAYVAGFVAATIALHLGGVGIGLWLRRQAWLRTAVGAFLAAAGAGLTVLAA